MKDHLILSLFPGIGLLDLAFEETGFVVLRGPDLLWGGDVKKFRSLPGRFDGVIGGPPCQAHSSLRHIVAHNHARHPDKYFPAEDLIPEFERIVHESQPRWFLMENVPDAPAACVPGYAVSVHIINNRWVPDTTEQNRERKISFGVRSHVPVSLVRYMEFSLFEPIGFEYAVTASGSRGGHPVPIRMNRNGKAKRLPKSREGNSRSVEDYARLQGLPVDFLNSSPFTVSGKKRVLGNGVPLPTGRALANAVAAWLDDPRLIGGGS